MLLEGIAAGRSDEGMYVSLPLNKNYIRRSASVYSRNM